MLFLYEELSRTKEIKTQQKMATQTVISRNSAHSRAQGTWSPPMGTRMT